MKYIIAFITLLAWPLVAQQTVSVTVTLSAEQVWALTQDYADYSADTNNAAMTKLQWFTMNTTNQILRVADRRVQIRKQEMLRTVADRWAALTPEQQTNVVNALPAQ